MSSRPLLQNGRTIRVIRKLKGLSLAEVARSTGSHPQTLRNLENEYRSASDELLIKVAEALDIDPFVIMRNPPKVGEDVPWTRFLTDTSYRARGVA